MCELLNVGVLYVFLYNVICYKGQESQDCEATINERVL
jgi:hypothetical protein